MLAAKSLDDRRKQSSGDRFIASDSHLSRGGVGEKLDILHALPHLVENRRRTVEKGRAIDGRFDSLRSAIQETDPRRAFEFAKGLRYGRLGNVQVFCRL